MIWLIALGLALAAGLAVLLIYRPWRESSEPSTESLVAQTFGRLLEGERGEVLEEMRRLYRRTRQNVGVGVALGSLLRHLGKCQAAIRTHRSITARVDIEPAAKAMAYAELAADYLACGLLGRAREAVDQALALKPDEAFAARVGERVYVRLEDWEGAVRLMRAYGFSARKDVSRRLGLLYCEQGARLLENGEAEASLAVFKKAISADKDCLPAYLAVSDYWRRAGKPDKAIAYLRKKWDRFSSAEWLAVEALRELAIDTGNPEPFLEAVERRLETDPADWRARACLARRCLETGDRQAAAEALDLCLEQAPNILLLHQLYWELVLRDAARDSALEGYRPFFQRDLADCERYVCSVCGCRDAKLRWICPGCHAGYSFTERTL